MKKLAALAMLLCLLPSSAFADINFDSKLNTVTHNSVSSPVTDTFTNTAGTLVIVGVATRPNGDQSTGEIYGGQAMTLVAKLNTNAASTWIYIYKLKSPPTGSNTISTSFSGTGSDIRVAAVSYSGASDIEASTTGIQASATSWTGSVTTITDRDRVGAFVMNDQTDNVATSPAVMRTTTPNNDPGISDLNSAQTPPGSFSIGGSIVGGLSGNYGYIVFAICPTGCGVVAAPFPQFISSTWWW